MRYVWIVILALAIAAGMIGCQRGSETSTEQPAKSSSRETYTCPMHPEVTADKPGNCPKCGMKLVKK